MLVISVVVGVKMDCAEDFLMKHVTRDKTQHLAIFVDDVWAAEHLGPLKNAKFAVVSSRFEVPGEQNIKSVSVPLSLVEQEAWEVFKSVSGKADMRNSGAIRRMLESVSFNALATTAIAVRLKDAEETEFEGIESVLGELLDKWDTDWDPSNSLFPSQKERNIAKVLEWTVEQLEDGRRADFDRLIVFPTDELITERRFAAFYNNNKFRAKSSLEFLAR